MQGWFNIDISFLYFGFLSSAFDVNNAIDRLTNGGGSSSLTIITGYALHYLNLKRISRILLLSFSLIIKTHVDTYSWRERMFFNVSLFFAFDYRKNNRLSRGVVIQQQNVTNIKAKGRDCRGVEDANDDEEEQGRDFDIWERWKCFTKKSYKMVDTQHFCLRWNNYQSSITSAFENLRDDEDFVDVTLACDGRSLKAHRVVLSACSPYFRELLKVSNNWGIFLLTLTLFVVLFEQSIQFLSIYSQMHFFLLLPRLLFIREMQRVNAKPKRKSPKKTAKKRHSKWQLNDNFISKSNESGTYARIEMNFEKVSFVW